MRLLLARMPGSVQRPAFRLTITCLAHLVHVCLLSAGSAHGGERMSSKSIAEHLRRLRPYLLPGGGGVTLSGGEPLLQPHFTATVMREALALGLTTCMDTTGQGSKHHNWDAVLPYTDMVLFCIKVRGPAARTAACLHPHARPPHDRCAAWA